MVDVRTVSRIYTLLLDTIRPYLRIREKKNKLTVTIYKRLILCDQRMKLVLFAWASCTNLHVIEIPKLNIT